MPYILAIAVVGIAVVLGIFTGVWGGLVWLVAAGIVLAAAFAFSARSKTVPAARPTPDGRPSGGTAAPGTANERVGQR
jgi:hypothetical protein